MADRDDMMKKFGPRLLEAVALVVIDEINILRAKKNLPPRTAGQLLNAINNKLDTLPPYDWMTIEF